MKISEKFNKIINEIEYTVKNDYEKLTARAQLDMIVQNNGYCISDLRSFNAAFQFITEILPLEYIKRRRLMYAYEALINQKQYNIEKAFVIAGYDNQNSFSKKFRNEFNMTPRQAWSQKNKEMVQPPMFWNTLEGTELQMNNSSNITETEQTILGLNEKTYNKLIEFQNLCSLYGVRVEQGEAAYAIAEKYNMDIDKAFDYISNIPYITKEMFIKNGYESYFGELDEGEKPITPEEFDPKRYYMESVDDADMIYCLIHCGLSFNEASEALDRLSDAYYDYDPQSCSAAFLYACAHSNSVTDYIEKATNYFISQTIDEFDYERFDIFLEEIDSYTPIEEAFEYTMTYLTDSDIDDLTEDLISGKNDYYSYYSEDESLDAFFDSLEDRRKNW